MNIRPGEHYTIRRKFFRIFGASFRIVDPAGKVVGVCKQKAFKLKEDFRIYTDDSQSVELVAIKARNILDFSATYDVTLPSGQVIGSWRRRGISSTFFRDAWVAFDPAGRQIATLQEKSGLLAILRRKLGIIAMLFPQKFILRTEDGRQIARFRTHINPILYRLSIAVLENDDQLDDLMILVAGCLIAAIEGRQVDY